MLGKETEELLIKLETDILAAQKSGDFSAISNLLADDFQEIGSSGRVYSKAEVLQAIQAGPLLDYAVESFKLLPINDGTVIVTYIATSRRISTGTERVNRAYRSSTWVRRDGSWRMVFHQGTPIPAP